MATLTKRNARKALQTGPITSTYWVDLNYVGLTQRPHVAIEYGDYILRIEMDAAVPFANEIMRAYADYQSHNGKAPSKVDNPPATTITPIDDVLDDVFERHGPPETRTSFLNIRVAPAVDAFVNNKDKKEYLAAVAGGMEPYPDVYYLPASFPNDTQEVIWALGLGIKGGGAEIVRKLQAIERQWIAKGAKRNFDFEAHGV